MRQDIQYIRTFNTKAKDFVILRCVKGVQYSSPLQAQNAVVTVLASAEVTLRWTT